MVTSIFTPTELVKQFDRRTQETEKRVTALVASLKALNHGSGDRKAIDTLADEIGDATFALMNHINAAAENLRANWREADQTRIPSVDDFAAGRDLAVEYLHAIDQANAKLADVEYVAYHAGLLQPYLRRLIDEPRLAHGFDAVVSNFVGMVLEGTVPDIAAVSGFTHSKVYGPNYEQFGG
jgi:hypothetical protein